MKSLQNGQKVFKPVSPQDIEKHKCVCHSREEQQKKHEITNAIQAIETLLDSSSQRLTFVQDKTGDTVMVGWNQVTTSSIKHDCTKKVIMALKLTRKIQSKYFPVETRSIKRSMDSVDKKGNYKPHPSKQNYPKYKKTQDIKKGKQKVIV